MPTYVDLINQVQKILPIRFGGTGNDKGYATERLVLPFVNGFGATLDLGTLVKLKAVYSDRRVIPTTNEKELTTIGVVVGRESTDPATLHQFEEIAPTVSDVVLVCLSGRCRVLVDSAVTVGEFAQASGTDGQAESVVFPGVGTIGQFNTSTSGAGMADVILYGGAVRIGLQLAELQATIGDGITLITPGILGYIRVPFDCTITGCFMYAKDSGSCVIDVKKADYAGVAGSLATLIGGAGTKPTITTSIKSRDETLTDWTVELLEDDVLQFSVVSATSITQVDVILAVRRH